MADDELPPNKQGLATNAPGDEEEKLLSPEDTAALEAFCADIELEDMEFAAWQQLHHNLDLLVYATLSLEEACQGGEKEISFVRTVSVLSAQAELVDRRKERVTRRVLWPANLRRDHVCLLLGEGDRYGDECGDLRVVLRLPRA